MRNNNKKVIDVDKDINTNPKQDLSLLDKEVKDVKHDIKDDYILEVNNLKMYFPIAVSVFKTIPLKAVDNVSFKIRRGETLGLVGESGCGKTTLGRTILQLYKPTSGDIIFNGKPVKGKTALKNFRKKATIVFQDPYSSLDPRMTVNDIISEPLRIHHTCREDALKGRENYLQEGPKEKAKLQEIKQELAKLKLELADIKKSEVVKNDEKAVKAKDDKIQNASVAINVKNNEYVAQKAHIKELKLRCKEKFYMDNKVAELMEVVGLSKEHASRYVHSFSGGQRQRIGIARALASSPEFIMCDEPVSALDVSIQAQILNTFQDLQKRFGLTYLFVAHNLLVVKHISDRIAVMYLGHIVELANSEELYDKPLHPYTISLLSSIPEPDPIKARSNQRQILEGDIPSPLKAPSGCPFRTRCPKATKECAEARPELREISKEHFVACRLFEK